ncbi:hypothetical protein [Arachidicoccus soli]|nr:hypothetical protein [Arachidicoccus soli]
MKLNSFFLTCMLFTCISLSAQQFSNIEVGVNSTSGQYKITSNALHWTFSGTVGEGLSDISQGNGSDEVGSFKSISFSWNKGQDIGRIRWYNAAPVVIFTITLPEGSSAPLSSFPDFDVIPSDLYHFSYHNDHFAWPRFLLEQTSTPWLLYDKQNKACIISPASHFMVAKMKGDGLHQIASSLNAEITSFPKGFSYSTIMVLDNSIHKSWNNWGTALRSLYHRNFPDKDADPLLKYYGYWTDNGADYYYNYDTTIGYSNTLLKLKQYYQQQHIPIGYMQLDSWWYEKTDYGPNDKLGDDFKNKNLPRGPWNRYGGLMEYRADPFLFPHGMASFQRKLGLPLATHNRWIDPRSPYHQQYNVSGIMSPDPLFWKDIMSYLKSSGVVCYEQDWLDFIYRNSPEMGATLNVADSFTDGMANAAAKEKMNLQYCMAMPRYFLQGLKYNNLTTIRTSDDRFNPEKWMKFIFTSQLAYETGAMPWCDVFKSTELGNMILSVLSSGPVGTGDAIGKESKHNIMLSCREDGQIVRPDVPILPLDQDFIMMANHKHSPILAYTYTKHQSVTTNYLFAFCNHAEDEKIFHFRPAELGMKNEVIVYNPISKEAKEVDAKDLFSDKIPESNYAYYILAPVSSSGIAFLGDENKIAATGKKRIASIEEVGSQLKIKVLFAPSEQQVILQGYSRSSIHSNIGKVTIDPATHLFSLKLSKPNNSNQAEVILNP